MKIKINVYPPVPTFLRAATGSTGIFFRPNDNNLSLEAGLAINWFLRKILSTFIQNLSYPADRQTDRPCHMTSFCSGGNDSKLLLLTVHTIPVCMIAGSC